MADRGLTHGLKYQARAIAPVLADPRRVCWLVGTNAVREENEVQVLEFDLERDELRPVAVFVHAHEIWSITPSPADAGSFITVHNDGGKYGATLWQARPGSQQLAAKARLSDCAGVLHAVLWRGDRLAAVESGRLRLLQLADGGLRDSGGAAPSAEPDSELRGGCWDPKDDNRVATAGGDGFQVWDVRNSRRTGNWAGAHALPTRDVDFARQTPDVLVSTGDDSRLRFWDLRAGPGSRPLMELGGHAHTVWRARHNPFYDQLLLSCSSDATVGLWYAPSVSSAAAAARPGGGGAGPASPVITGKAPGDGRAKSFADHEESVYGVAWSSVEPWVFASVSYDGRVAANRVPSQIKYKILI